MAFRFGFYAIVLAIGLLTLFHDTIFSGFNLVVGDPGDARLSNYFLEHSFQWLINRQYSGSLFSPTFFSPQPDVLAFSENLLGTAPIYWLCRSVFSSSVAFSLWAMIVSSLNYASMLFVLRRLCVHPVLASLGGFLMAFSLVRAMHLPHVQMLPQFFTPILLLTLWNFLQSPTSRRLLLLLGLSYWQMLSGIYVGWFTGLGMIVMTVVGCLILPKTLQNVWRFSKHRWRLVIPAFTLWSIGMGALFAPYLRIQSMTGIRSYEEVRTMLPRLRSWFVLFESGTLWGGVFKDIGKKLPMLHEHTLFLGMLLYGLIAWTVFILLKAAWFKQPCGWLPIERRQTVQVFLGSAAVLFFLSLMLPGGFSAWVLIYKLVPGAKGIRAVARICTLINIYALIGVLVTLDAYLALPYWRRNAKAILLTLLLSFTVAEQSMARQLTYDQGQVQSSQQEMTRLLTQNNCQLAYYNFPPGQGSPPQFPRLHTGQLPEQLIWIYAQIGIMWSGLAANVPVINGYSGNIPPGFPVTSANWPVAKTLDWIAQRQALPPSGAFCYITDRAIATSSTTPLPTSWQLARTVTSANYAMNVFKSQKR